MKVKITNKKIIETLEKKNEYVVANQTLLKEMERLEREFQTNLSKAQRLDEKVRPMIKKDVEGMKLGEFEELSRVTKESGEWELDIADRLEEFKAMYKERKG